LRPNESKEPNQALQPTAAKPPWPISDVWQKMKTIIIAAFASLVLSGCATGDVHSDRLLGRYQPFGIDAGIFLTLLEKDVFIADWWGQERKNGNILGGWTSGSWHREGNSLVLRYVTNKKKSESTFMIDQKDGKPLLRLVREGEFPFVAFFGGEYPKEQERHETFEMSFQAIRKRHEK